MANYHFNIAKGHVPAYFERVKNNDPSTSAIVLIPLSASGSESEAQDYDTVAAVLAGAANEQTDASWGRKVLTDADLPSQAPDDTNNRYPATIPQVTWAGPTTGHDTTGVLVAYDANTGSGDDTNLIPLVHLDMPVTADGNAVVINAGDVSRAS